MLRRTKIYDQNYRKQNIRKKKIIIEIARTDSKSIFKQKKRLLLNATKDLATGTLWKIHRKFKKKAFS